MYHSYYEERIKKIMVQREYMQVRAGTEKQKKEEKKKKSRLGMRWCTGVGRSGSMAGVWTGIRDAGRLCHWWRWSCFFC